MKYAAYDDMSIYAIGDTPEAAIQKARDDAREPEAQFKTAPIKDGLAAAIEDAGWNPHLESFALDEYGYIVDTTSDA
jgi:hypothetical protein